MTGSVEGRDTDTEPTAAERRAVVARRRVRSADLTEITQLAAAAGYDVVGELTQTRTEDAAFMFGEGKVAELRDLVRRTDANAVIIDNDVGPYQTFNIGGELPEGVEVIDRFALILEIFGQRANTRKAQLQVELAELRYELPRAEAKASLAKRDERPGFMGLGEYDESVERDIKRQISEIRDELASIAEKEEARREQRRDSGFDLVALAGYTNAGKSTLMMRRLAAAEIDVDDETPSATPTSTRPPSPKTCCSPLSGRPPAGQRWKSAMSSSPTRSDSSLISPLAGGVVRVDARFGVPRRPCTTRRRRQRARRNNAREARYEPRHPLRAQRTRRSSPCSTRSTGWRRASWRTSAPRSRVSRQIPSPFRQNERRRRGAPRPRRGGATGLGARAARPPLSDDAMSPRLVDPRPRPRRGGRRTRTIKSPSTSRRSRRSWRALGRKRPASRPRGRRRLLPHAGVSDKVYVPSLAW